MKYYDYAAENWIVIGMIHERRESLVHGDLELPASGRTGGEAERLHQGCFIERAIKIPRLLPLVRNNALLITAAGAQRL